MKILSENLSKAYQKFVFSRHLVFRKTWHSRKVDGITVPFFDDLKLFLRKELSEYSIEKENFDSFINTDYFEYKSEAELMRFMLEWG